MLMGRGQRTNRFTCCLLGVMGGYGQEALKTLLKRFTSSKAAVLRSSIGNEIIDRDFFKGKAGGDFFFFFLYLPRKYVFSLLWKMFVVVRRFRRYVPSHSI